MATLINQIRYYGDNNTSADSKDSPQLTNYPEGITSSGLASGNYIQDYLPTSYLGIQTIPGAKFYLNEATSPIIVGASGIFELDNLTSGNEITKIQFATSTLELIEQLPSGYLIIDWIRDE